MKALKEDTLKAMACARCGYGRGTQSWCDGIYCTKWMKFLSPSDREKLLNGDTTNKEKP